MDLHVLQSLGLNEARAVSAEGWLALVRFDSFSLVRVGALDAISQLIVQHFEIDLKQTDSVTSLGLSRKAS